MPISPPGRRPDAWWVPRSSKPVRGLIGPWRVRFPSASATSAAPTASIEPLKKSRPDLAFSRNGDRDNRPSCDRDRVRWCRHEPGQAERARRARSGSSRYLRAVERRPGQRGDRPRRRVVPELPAGASIDDARSAIPGLWVDDRIVRDHGPLAKGATLEPLRRFEIRLPAATSLRVVYRADGALGTIATATMLVKGGH
jgi:hypothetical protein